jgi:hypothetical protein
MAADRVAGGPDRTQQTPGGTEADVQEGIDETKKGLNTGNLVADVSGTGDGVNATRPE